MRAELSRVEISGPAELVAHAEKAADDLRAAGRIVGDLVFTPGDATEAGELTVTAEIAPQPE
jgi:valyl-tRNA synthetase